MIMRLLSISLLLLFNVTSIVADTGKTEPPKFDRHPDEKPPKFDRDGTDAPEDIVELPTDAPVPPPTPRPTDAPVFFWPPTPAPVRPPPPTRPPTPSPTPPPTRSPTPPPVFVPVIAPVPAPVLREDDPAEDIIFFPPTPEPTPLPTPNPTPQPTPNPTPLPTPNPTPQPTPNPTPLPTPNPTPQPTPQPTTALPTPPQNIFDLAAETGKFDSLLGHIGNTPGVLPAVVSNMPVTIFGPTDIAFGDGSADGLDPEALGAVIGGHVVSGVYTTQDIIEAGCMELFSLANVPLRIRYANGQITINDAQVTCDDVTGPGGNILGVGSVILPGSFRPCRNGYVENAFANGAPYPPMVQTGSMYDAANANGDYGILLAAITRSTGVMDAIAGHGDVTIFGPNDAAYNAMYEMLATTDIPDVGRMFSGHVVKGFISLRDMIDAGCMELFTMAGTRIRVLVQNEMVYVNDALLVGPDMAGSDGIIQGIDKLLMPDSFQPCPRGQSSGTVDNNIRFGAPDDEPESPPSIPQEDEEEDDDEEDDDDEEEDKKDDRIRRLRGPSDKR